MIGPWHPFGEGPHGLKSQNKPYAQVLAERPLKPSAPQQPADVGLFSDDAAQTDLIDYLRK